MKKVLLLIECAIFFIVIPISLYAFRHHLAFKIIPIVFIISALCFFYLVRDKAFDNKILWNTEKLLYHLKHILLTFIIPAGIISLYTYQFLDPHFLAFPKSKPSIWGIVIFLYPLLAAFPQEIVFRCFFFHRYKSLFPNTPVMIIFNGLSFGLAHLFYDNWFAPALSACGGILFAYRYVKSQSLLPAGIEHGLWGNFLFTVGMRWYFYSGSISH